MPVLMPVLVRCLITFTRQTTRFVSAIGNIRIQGQLALELLPRAQNTQARVPLRVSGDASVHSPRHMTIARITLDNCVAFSLNGHVCIARVAARLVRAIRHVGVDRERTLKVLE